MLKSKSPKEDKTRNMNEQNEMHVRKDEKIMKEAATLTPEIKRTNEKATLYEHGDYRVCVIEKGDMFEAWLAHKEYGVASLMFGWPKVQPVEPDKVYSLNEFLDMVKNSLEEHKRIYFDEIEDLDYP